MVAFFWKVRPSICDKSLLIKQSLNEATKPLLPLQRAIFDALTFIGRANVRDEPSSMGLEGAKTASGKTGTVISIKIALESVIQTALDRMPVGPH